MVSTPPETPSSLLTQATVRPPQRFGSSPTPSTTPSRIALSLDQQPALHLAPSSSPPAPEQETTAISSRPTQLHRPDPTCRSMPSTQPEPLAAAITAALPSQTITS